MSSQGVHPEGCPGSEPPTPFLPISGGSFPGLVNIHGRVPSEACSRGRVIIFISVLEVILSLNAEGSDSIKSQPEFPSRALKPWKFSSGACMGFYDTELGTAFPFNHSQEIKRHSGIKWGTFLNSEFLSQNGQLAFKLQNWVM